MACALLGSTVHRELLAIGGCEVLADWLKGVEVHLVKMI
jgi:hypothetical protein